MKKLLLQLNLVLAAAALACCSADDKGTSSAPRPPVAEKKPDTLVTHGHKRIDNYFWMRLTDEQKTAPEKDEQAKKVLAHLTAENEYRTAKLAHTKELQEKLYKEITGRIKQKDESVPYRNNGYWYYVRYEEGQEYPIHCRRKGTMQAPEEVLLNVNDMAKGHAYYSITGLSVSEDNSLLAYAEDSVSRRKYTIYVKDLRTGRLAGQPVANTEGAATWAADNKTFFYTRKDPETLRSRWIMKHRVGDDPSKDEAVYEEKDETFYTRIYKTKSRKYLVIHSNSTLTSDVRILRSDDPDGAFRMFTPRQRGIEYSIDHYRDKFYVVTNDQATNFRLMETPETRTERPNWKEKIPNRGDTLLESIEVFDDYLVVHERARANTHYGIIDQRTGRKHYLNFGEPAYGLFGSVNLDYDTDWIRYGYTSLTTPYSTFEYNMATREKKLLKQQEIVGGHDPSAYTTERLWATARDGTQVPISIVYKKGFRKDGTSPLLLSGYGSYGYSNDPYFYIPHLSLLDRGFAFAIAHIRGGQEMGRQWYEDGKMFKKKNTFNDFIDCAEFLIAGKYTSKENLFAQGGSAGGLLMGAVVNMRPDLFKGVLAQVPFVDVVSTMLDESIPLTTGEFDEWGNPKELESYLYMLSYSPYDQVRPASYPNMMVTTGFHDSQVQYWEPAKWVAKLRELKTDSNTLVLRTNMDTGHGAASGRFRAYYEVAEELAFVLDLAGIRQ